jgi:hypothetical protein
MEESSSKNAAMVLKITETSQGNVCPVDICLDFDYLRKSYNDLQRITVSNTGEGERSIRPIY